MRLKWQNLCQGKWQILEVLLPAMPAECWMPGCLVRLLSALLRATHQYQTHTVAYAPNTTQDIVTALTVSSSLPPPLLLPIQRDQHYWASKLGGRAPTLTLKTLPPALYYPQLWGLKVYITPNSEVTKLHNANLYLGPPHTITRVVKCQILLCGAHTQTNCYTIVNDPWYFATLYQIYK